MKFSFSWLKEHIDLKPEVGLSDIIDALTYLGLEVEKFDDPAEKLKSFVVAQIIEVKVHPNADRLSICKVDIGTRSVEVVCGANNVKKSLKVVFAPIGSTIPSSGMKLKKKEIRGFTGEGMLCSGEELGIEESSSGILELASDVMIGTNLADLDNYNDAIIEIGLTPNRGDCASVMGIAKEIAALDLGSVKQRKAKVISDSFISPIKWKIDLDDQNKSACQFVSGRYFKGLKNRESPEWLKRRLIAIGLKPISCLVDLTNFITFDLGRPLHVFDAKKLNGDLTIRMAKENENIKALDGKEYKLNDDILVISDKNKVVSLAGVMGGEDTSCDLNTTEVFLESALFDPIYISNSGRKLNILSDARYRFERGVDNNYVEEGLNIMTSLVLELCGGKVSKIVTSGSLKVEQKVFNYYFDKVNNYSGLNISEAKQIQLLEKLGFIIKANKKYCEVTVPSWRNDITADIDLVEEIIRLNGYDKIEELDLPNYKSDQSLLNVNEIRNRLIKNSLIKRGLYESVTFSFLSAKDAKLYSNEKSLIELDNPISEELSIMRNSLLPNLVNNFLNNINKGLKNTGLFEVGSIYFGENAEDQNNSAAGIRAGIAGNRHWDVTARKVDLYDVKKDIFWALNNIGVNLNNISLNIDTPKWYHPGRSGSIKLGKSILGYFGELHPSLTKKYDMRIMAFEIFPDNLPQSFKRKNNGTFKQYNLMPIKRDYSFYISSETSSKDIEDTIKKTLKDNALIELLEINIFDLYNNKTSSDDRISIALEVVMQPIENTLNDNDIRGITESIIQNIKEKNNAILKD